MCYVIPGGWRGLCESTGVSYDRGVTIAVLPGLCDDCGVLRLLCVTTAVLRLLCVTTAVCYACFVTTAVLRLLSYKRYVLRLLCITTAVLRLLCSYILSRYRGSP